jgi:hypothetical protein
MVRDPLTAISGLMPIGTVPIGSSVSQTGVGQLNNIVGNAASLGGGVENAMSGFSKALPFIGLGLSAASTVMSFVEAGKAADAQRAAQKAAEAAAAEQKRLQEQNFYEALQAPTEAYDRQFREGTAMNAQAVQALAQDPRMLLGGLQGVQQASIEGQAQAREALADRLYNLDVVKAQAATQQADDLSKIAADEAQGAQIAAMAAEKAKIKQQAAGLEGVGNLITQGAGMIGTYGKMATPEDRLNMFTSAVGNSSFGGQQKNNSLMSMLSGATPEQLQSIMQFLNK